MLHDNTQFIELKSGNTLPRRIAYVVGEGQDDKPGLFWLSGFKSNMRSQKVTELAAWSHANNIRLCRFDYSGHGESGGEFENGTISQWLDEAVHIFEQKTNGPQILVGSSMGGWIGLLLCRKLLEKSIDRVAGCVFIAPAWDMTETLMWDRFPEPVRAELLRNGKFDRPSDYDDGPYTITQTLIEDGRRHLIRASGFSVQCPVRIIHGMQDPDVPWKHSVQLLEHLEDEDVTITLIKDGEHRLSRPQDIRTLLNEISLLLTKTV